MAENAAGAKREETPDEVMVSLYAAQEKIYPRSVSGIFSKWRWVMIWITQIVFYGVPWLQWGERQAVLFNLEARRFYIFDLVLYPQDLIYLTAILIISALSLFLFTAVAGRLWCGYTCPQTVYTEIFLWFEKVIEGDRAARMKLDKSGMTAEKVTKKSLKHLVWGLFALWTGFTFVGYFTPIRELLQNWMVLQMGPWETFWVFFYGFATYGNAGFMREQVCKYMCPYARFQSAMFDKDTLIVTYDDERGEPRGSRSRKDDAKSLGLGSCIDCNLCVQVCPTGIDIRKGLQYECIGCGACADVCDTVMDKVGYPRGLIRYTTENGMHNHWTSSEILRRVLRPRVLIYFSILALLVIGLLTSLAVRTPFMADVVRDRGVMSRIVEGGLLENVYRMQLMNATENTQSYRIEARGEDGLLLKSPDLDAAGSVILEPAQSKWITLYLQIPDGNLEPGSHRVWFDVEMLGSDKVLEEKSVFLVPR
ncbi:MAG: cytochrome c oxidase accessory protein CcoG [Betaproteobacteria bacterium HGW-Betaproteobacteria-1]|jgi:cytochrome c oxidase accessory protein FixG|nr:MAG: cytochrome c oxidase accessory protein CcoG [Betaproteobacteria bacterium HGW-Betaproteobacteria-1]